MFLVGNIYPKIQREKKKYQQTKKKKNTVFRNYLFSMF